MISFPINFLVGFILNKWTFLSSIIAYFAYKWTMSTYDVFKTRGLKFIPPTPILGNFKEIVLQTKTFRDILESMYRYFPSEKVYGIFEMRKPIFFIRDPELIKQLTIKDFDHFQDHRVNIEEKVEPLFGRSLIVLRGKRWRDMRSTLSPAFTGSKMRTMFRLVSECCSDTVNYLEKEIQGEKPLLTDLKDLFTRFTNDVIATCAFGLKVDSLKNKDNDFYMAGKEATDFTAYRGLKFFIIVQFPKIAKALKITVFPVKFYTFFSNIIRDTIKQREQENIVRPDMINLLIQTKKGNLRHEDEGMEKEGFAVVKESKVGEAIQQGKLEQDDLTAQCLLFFLAGFETSSSCMSFTAHELAVNPDVQRTLIAEVDATKDKLGGSPLTYEALQDMPYLDMVISESLRLWPPAAALDRQCVKPYKLKVDGMSYDIMAGEGILIPVLSLHRDPKYFPDPDRYNPERFSEENKQYITPFTYLPFGVGPRGCIGSRFALMETKAIIYYILTKFTFEVSEKTQVPLQLAISALRMMPEKGFWVDLKPRNR